MFKVKVVFKTDTKEMILDEAALKTHVLGFVVYQAKKFGETTTMVVNQGETMPGILNIYQMKDSFF